MARWYRRIEAGPLLAGALAVVSLLLLAACGGSKASTPRAAATGAGETAGGYRLLGSVTAPECGTGFAITSAAVIVRDEHDTIIGSTVTTQNVAPKPTPLPDGLDLQGTDHIKVAAYEAALRLCTAQFSVVLPKANFYQVLVGSHGSPVHTFAQLQQLGWKLDLSLN